MPELSFDLNLGSLLSPVLLGVLAWIVNAARKAVEHRVDERHAETTGHLNRIESLAESTKSEVEGLKTSTKADHDILMQTVGKVDGIMSKGAP